MDAAIWLQWQDLISRSVIKSQKYLTRSKIPLPSETDLLQFVYHFSSPLRLVSSFCSNLVILTRSHLLLHAGSPDYFLCIAECHPICDKWNNLWRLFSDGFLHSQDSLVLWRWKKWESEAAFCIPCMWYAAFLMLWQRHFGISDLFLLLPFIFIQWFFDWSCWSWQLLPDNSLENSAFGQKKKKKK